MNGSRFAPARRRVTLAKAGLAAVGALAFASSAALARLSYAGHHKRRPRPLSAPPAFVQIVHENLLEAGLMAPAEAPPGAETATS